jgi:hypothetical protein
LAIALIGVDDERAAASHSNFMIELQKSLQDDLLGIEEGQAVNTALIEKETLLFGFLKSQAQQILSVYVREVLKVPRRSVAEHFVDVMVETVATFVFAKSDVSPWLAQAL